jgi:hypothetical protein
LELAGINHAEPLRIRTRPGFHEQFGIERKTTCSNMRDTVRSPGTICSRVFGSSGHLLLLFLAGVPTCLAGGVFA